MPGKQGKGSERSKATKKAHTYLDRHWSTIKERGDLNYMQAVNVVADFYQRGVNPADIDVIEEIDWKLDYGEVRAQAADLIEKGDAEDFESKKDVEGQVEKFQKVQGRMRDRLEQVREQARTAVEDLKERAGKLLGARNQAWKGYRIAIGEIPENMAPVNEAIMYAEAILELDEQLEEDFEGEFTELADVEDELRDLADRINALNFDAANIDQSAVPSDEKERGPLTDDDRSDAREWLVTDRLDDLEEHDRDEVIEEVADRYFTSEEAAEAIIEELFMEGTIYEPRPGMVRKL